MLPSTRRSLFSLALLAVGGLILAGALLYTMDRSSNETGASAVGGPFALVDHDNRPITDKDLAGAPFLIFFGFTHCPDVCPTALNEITQIFEAMGKDKKIRALFVTVDPERDTAVVLKDYVSNFDPRIVGVTGSPEALLAAQRAYRAYAKKVPLKDGDYTMDHTALIYIMDKKGRFVNGLNVDRSPAETAKELSRYL